MPIKNYDKRTFRSQELFPLLRAYLLYHTGKPLSTNKIARELRHICASDPFRGVCDTVFSFKGTDVTIAKYLKGMSDANELFELKREYVKPRFTKDNQSLPSSVSSGCAYYLLYTAEDVKEVVESPCYMGIARYYRPSRVKTPNWEPVYRRIEIFRQLISRDENLKCGSIVYHYFGEDKKTQKEGDHKVLIPVEFIANLDGVKKIVAVSGEHSMLLSYGEKYDSHRKKALLSIKRFAKIPGIVASIWNKEPTSDTYQDDKKRFLGSDYTIVPWNKL